MEQRVLVVDSDVKFATDVRAAFHDQGIDVKMLPDGDQVSEVAEQYRPQLIILSVELPSINGFLVCKKLKKDGVLKMIPLVLVSSDSNADEIFSQHQKLKARAELYCKKPITAKKLLDKVRPLLPSKSPSSPEIDLDSDFIEEIEVESTKVGAPPEQMSEALNVDDDIALFTDSAFDSMIVGDESPLPARGTGANGASNPRAPMPSEGPVIDVESDDAEPSTQNSFERSSVEPIAASPSQVRRSLESLRPRPASEPPPARAQQASYKSEPPPPSNAAIRSPEAAGIGISSRDVLELREQLSKKDKEILELHEQMHVRDRQLLETRERTLQLERGMVDRDTRINQLETQSTELSEQRRQINADKETAEKRAEDLKARLERSDAKIKKHEEALEQIEKDRDGLKATLEAVKRANEQGMQELNAQHSQELQTLKQEYASASAQKEQAFQEAQAALRADHEEVQARANARAAQQLTELEDKYKAAIDKLRSEHQSKLVDSENQHEQELERQASEHTQALAELTQRLQAEHQSELERARRQLAQEREQVVAELDAKREHALQEAKEQREASLAELQHDLETHFKEQLNQTHEKHNRELALLGRKLAEVEAALQGVRESEATLKAQLEQSQSQNEALSGERERLQAQLNAANALGASLEREKNEQAVRIDSMTVNQRNLEGQLEKLELKVRADEQILERAKKAMSIGLGLLEEQAKNVVSD